MFGNLVWKMMYLKGSDTNLVVAHKRFVGSMVMKEIESDVR